MPRYEFRMQRLFVDTSLHQAQRVDVERGHANYLLNVLRLKTGDAVLLFNGRDGEWRAIIESDGRKHAVLVCEEQTRMQTRPAALDYLFAPLKHARLDYMVQKAVEMGATRLQPVITRYTQVSRVNLARMRANAIEACEQCGVLSIPEICAPMSLDACFAALDRADPSPHLVFCDEGEKSQNPLPILNGIPGGPLAVLIGPEGGFSEAERNALRARDFVTAIPLGPRVLRADTAAVAALAVVQACVGDWRDV